MKKVFYGLIGLIVLFVGAALAGPSFVDWNAHKGWLAAEARKVIGRELIIDGDMTLTLLPAPALSAARVRIANIEGGSQPTMAELGELRVRIAPLSLLQGRVQVESVQLVEPRILLEVLADGRRNWALGETEPGAKRAASAPSSTGPRGAGGVAGQIRIDSFTITDGTLVYRDETSAVEERIERLDAQVAAESLNGPVTAKGRAMLRGIDTAFEVAIGQLLRGGATPLNLSFRLPAAEAELKFAGSLSMHATALRYRGHLEAEGRDLAAAIRALVPQAAPPASLGQAFALETEFEGDLAQLTGKDLRLRFGGNLLSGEAVVALGPPIDATVTLGATRFDLDKFLAAADAPGPAEPAADAGTPQTPATPFALPADFKARLELAVEGMIYRGQAIRQLRFDAFLEDGRLTLGEAKATLPGGSDLSFTGAVEPGDAAARVTARFELASDNLRSLARWLGADLTGVPPDRLRRLNFKGVVEGDTRQLSLKEIDLKVDLTRINGGIVVALRERLGLGIGLAVDQLNLDAYLPAPGAWSPEVEAAGASESKDEAVGGAAGEAAPGALGGLLTLLGRFDANMDVKLGKLSFRGAATRNLRLTATLQGGSLTLREVSLGDLAGGRVNFAGVVSGLAAAPTIEGTLDIEVSDPLRLAKAAKLDPTFLARLGPFKVTTSLRGTAQAITVDSEIAAQNGRLALAGSVEPSAGPLAFDLEVTVQHPELAGLARAWDLPFTLGPGLGSLDLRGRVVGTPLQVAVSDLLGHLGPLDVTGGLNADFSGPRPSLGALDLGLELEHPELARLLEELTGATPTERELGAIDLAARLTGSARRPSLGGLEGRVGPADLSGTIEADLTGARPAVKARLAAGELPLALFLVPLAKNTAAEDTERDRAHWSRSPIDITGLRALDADLQIAARTLLLDDMAFENATLRATLTDGLLDIKRLSGKLHGGTVALSGGITARQPLEADLTLTTEGVDLGPLLRDRTGFDGVAGPLNLKAELTTTGSSEAALVAALAGRGSLDGELTVTVPPADQPAVPGLRLPDGKVVEVVGISEAVAMLLSVFGGAPAILGGSFELDQGVLTSQDLRLEGGAGRATTRGTLRLPAWRVTSHSEVFTAEDPDTPYLTMDLKGPLDAPDLRVAGKPFEPEPEPPAPEPEPAPAALPETAPARDSTALPDPQEQPAGDLDLQPEATPEAQPSPRTQAETGPPAAAEAQAAPNPSAPAEAAPEPAVDSLLEAEPLVEPEVQPRVQGAAEPAPEPAPEAEAVVESEPVREAAPVAESEPEPVVAPSEPEPVAEAAVETQPEPEAAPEVESATESEPVVAPETAPEAEVVAESEPESAVEPEAEPAIETLTRTEPEPTAEPGPADDTAPQTARLPEPEPAPLEDSAETATPAPDWPPRPKVKPVFLALPGKPLPPAEAEAELQPALKQPAPESFIKRILTGLTSPEKPAPTLEPEPAPEPESEPDLEPKPTIDKSETGSFVGDILNKLKN